MKKIIILLLCVFTLTNFAQQVTINNIQDLGLINNTDNNLPENLKNGQYVSLEFKKANINKLSEPAFIRYNLYKDEMEFLKSNKIYFLKKSLGNKISFLESNDTYSVYSYNNKLRYFYIAKEGSSALLVKQEIKFIKAKPARTSYDKEKPAKFDRENDEYYVSLDGKNAIKVPRKKNDFYNLFKNDSKKIKDYMKKNRLKNKDLEDLKQIIDFYNTL